MAGVKVTGTPPLSPGRRAWKKTSGRQRQSLESPQLGASHQSSTNPASTQEPPLETPCSGEDDLPRSAPASNTSIHTTSPLIYCLRLRQSRRHNGLPRRLLGRLWCETPPLLPLPRAYRTGIFPFSRQTRRLTFYCQASLPAYGSSACSRRHPWPHECSGHTQSSPGVVPASDTGFRPSTRSRWPS